jgi:hypothetical protein
MHSLIGAALDSMWLEVQVISQIMNSTASAPNTNVLENK